MEKYGKRGDNWSTPTDFYEKLNDEFHFSVDVAASDENSKCERYYTVKSNGLAQDWTGETVWCNPPYGRQIRQWVCKAYSTVREGKSTVVMLLPARTDTEWFHDYVYGKAEIRFVKGRLKFGNVDQRARFPSMVVIYRQKGQL